MNYHTLAVNNNCNEPVKLAVNYLNPKNKKWEVAHWYSVKANAAMNLNNWNSQRLKTKNKILYYYAKSKNHEWSGQDKQDSVVKQIGNTLLSLRKMKISEGLWGPQTISLSCEKK
jgi:hypothetical protein